jgi:hypothetical protein
MKLEVKRLGDDGKATIGALYINGIFQCFTIEDEEREIKVKGETRVPEGTYDVLLRSEGGYHLKYTEKYGDMHVGMLCIHNVRDGWKLVTPNMEFQYILIHTGNHEGHTNGCLLLNDSANSSNNTGSGSVSAYKRVYPKIASALMDGESVTITYTDIEDGK